MEYKYSLEKGSKKNKCPQCGKTRYVRYINNETNEYLEYNYGRCDRETSCGYFNSPNLKNTPFMQSFEIPVKKPIGYIDDKIPPSTFKQYENNHLFNFLLKYFDKKEILSVFNKYNIGTSKKWNGSTVFWQTDKYGKYRTGKIMLYNSTSGKRVKLPYNHISWAYKSLNLNDFNLKQCLFGLHLINDNNKVIGLVESEKTAIILSLTIPNTLWLATGSKQNLKEELLNSIKNKKIIIYPDKGEFDDWNKKCNCLNTKGFNISCSEIMERSNLDKGSDFADLIIDNQYITKSKKENKVLSPPEEKLLTLSAKNPDIKKFIKNFNLTDEAGNELNKWDKTG